MRKLLFMFAMLLVCSVASAQQDTTATRTKTTEKSKTATKSKAAEKTTQPATTKRERAIGTTGTIQHPDTEGAGTGTGNDSKIPPGKAEKLEEK